MYGSTLSRPRATPARRQSIADHARLRFPRGEKAKRYNVLQRLSLSVFALWSLPLIILDRLDDVAGHGLRVSVFDLGLLGGRQTARTIHFIGAFTVVGFVIIHVAMVLLSGVLEQHSLDDHRLVCSQTARHVLMAKRFDRRRVIDGAAAILARSARRLRSVFAEPRRAKSLRQRGSPDRKRNGFYHRGNPWLGVSQGFRYLMHFKANGSTDLPTSRL